MAKNYTTNGVYDNHSKTLEILAPFLYDNRHIFITTAQLLPLFADNISTDFENTRKSKKRNIHWYFPVADSPSMMFKKLISADVKKERHLMGNALWGALNKTTTFNSSRSIACLSLKGGDFVINLHKPKVLFRDRQNIFLTSLKVIPSKRCFEQ
jgi:hypothetical protein